MEVKYVIHPRWVISKSDGDDHYIGYSSLMKLYGVNPQECVNYDTYVNKRLLGEHGELVHLYPSYHGNYNLDER